MSQHPPHRRGALAWIEQAGARAAEALLSWRANPYLRRENMPSQTGESLHEWSRKHDAWQRGFEREDEEAASRNEEPHRAAPAEVVERPARWTLLLRKGFGRFRR